MNKKYIFQNLIIRNPIFKQYFKDSFIIPINLKLISYKESEKFYILCNPPISLPQAIQKIENNSKMRSTVSNPISLSIFQKKFSIIILGGGGGGGGMRKSP